MTRAVLRKRGFGRAPRGRGGFTLVEILVTLVIAVIVIGISGSLVITSTNILSRSAQRDMQMNIAESALEFVSGQLLYAYSISEKDGVNVPGEDSFGYPATGGAVIHIKAQTASGLAGDDRGQLYFRRNGDSSGDAVNVFGDGFYHNYRISISYRVIRSDAGKASVTLTVDVYNSLDRLVLSRTTTKPLLNLDGSAPVMDEEKRLGYPNGGYLLIE